MDNQMNNQNNINNTPMQTPLGEPINGSTMSAQEPVAPIQAPAAPVSEPIAPVEAKPSLMRESIDANGNSVYETNNQGPDMADKTIKAVEEFMNTADHKDEYDPQEIKQHRAFAVFSYIPITCLIFLIMGKHKQSNYMKFHLNQGLVITIIIATVSIITLILELIFTTDSMLKNNTPVWVSFLSFFLYSICLIMMLYGIANTASNSSKEIPIIGQIQLLK